MELTYIEKLQIFHDYFVKYTLDYIEWQKKIEHGLEVPAMTTSLRDSFIVLRLIPIVKDGVDIVSCATDLWNGRLYEISSISINKIFSYSDIETIKILSNSIQKIAIYLELKLNQFQSRQEIGAFATASMIKLVASLKKTSSEEAAKISSEYIVNAILKQHEWFKKDAFLFQRHETSENYYFVNIAAIETYIEERDNDDLSIYKEIDSSVGLVDKIKLLPIEFINVFCEHIRNTYKSSASKQIVVVLEEDVTFPTYMILETISFNTDISSLRIDILEAKTEAFLMMIWMYFIQKYLVQWLHFINLIMLRKLYYVQ